MLELLRKLFNPMLHKPTLIWSVMRPDPCSSYPRWTTKINGERIETTAIYDVYRDDWWPNWTETIRIWETVQGYYYGFSGCLRVDGALPDLIKGRADTLVEAQIKAEHLDRTPSPERNWHGSALNREGHSSSWYNEDGTLTTEGKTHKTGHYETTHGR